MAGLRVVGLVVLLAGCAAVPQAQESAVRVVDKPELVMDCERLESFVVRARAPLTGGSAARFGDDAASERAAGNPAADTVVVASYKQAASPWPTYDYTAFSYQCFGGPAME